MINLTQDEFETNVKRLINNEISRKALAKELDTDIRTLNKKITKLSETNPDLYLEFVSKFPYRPREIKIDIEELALYAIIHGTHKAAEEYEISDKTVGRKVKKLEKTNPEIYGLYNERIKIEGKNVSKENKDKYIYNVSKFLDTLVKTKKQDRVQEKRDSLRKIIQDFERLVASGMSKAKAARELGYDDYPTIWKKYQELNRIETELKTRALENDFKKEIEVSISTQKFENEQVKTSVETYKQEGLQEK